MGYPIRHQTKDAIFFISNRTDKQHFLFRPGPEVNTIILDILAKTAHRYSIEIYAFVFMSNHFHLIARSPTLQMHPFMRDLESEMATKLNLHWGRSGKFYEQRYTPIPILDDDACVDRLCYTMCNPCQSNLVSHPKKWPGLSSWQYFLDGKPYVGKYVDRQEYWRIKRKKGNEDMAEAAVIEAATRRYTLEMAKLPMWEDLDDDAYRQKVCEHIEARAAELADSRKRPCLGRQKVMRQRFDQRPAQPKKSPRPRCLTNCPITRASYIELHKAITNHYKAAVQKLRANRAPVSFPAGTIPPGHQLAVGA